MRLLRSVLPALCFALLIILSADPLQAQTPDTLPQLNPSAYIPSSVDGFERTSTSGLSETDRQVMTGVQMGAKAYWEKPNRPFRIVAFDVSTDVYRFDSPANARGSVQRDFQKKTGQFGRDTLAGLPVVTVENQSISGSADYFIGYQQATLGIRVWATQTVTSGSPSLEEVIEAARQAFREIVREARSSG